jgi:hypothetical protein
MRLGADSWLEAHLSVPHLHALGSQSLCLIRAVPGREAAIGTDDPPPRQAFGRGEEIANGPGRSREARIEGNLPIGAHPAGWDGLDDLDDLFLEGPGHRGI